jgi:hypothetical protein
LNRILVAVARPSAIGVDPQLQVFGGSLDSLFTADNIAANTITANEISANTIDASRMNVSQLSSISANIGNITAGDITGVNITSSSSGNAIKLTTGDTLEFYLANVYKGGLYVDASGDLYLNAMDDVVFAVQGDDKVQVGNTEMIPLDSSYGLGRSGDEWEKGFFIDLDVDDDLTVGGGCTGCAYRELNLLTPQQKDIYFQKRTDDVKVRKEKKKKNLYNPTGYEEGTVLAWKEGELVPVKKDTCKCVIAVSAKDGMPQVLGAEYVFVYGKCSEGDLLVSSDELGCARAWTDKTDPPMGTVIAQALEDKKEVKKGLVKSFITKM